MSLCLLSSPLHSLVEDGALLYYVLFWRKVVVIFTHDNLVVVLDHCCCSESERLENVFTPNHVD